MQTQMNADQRKEQTCLGSFFICVYARAIPGASPRLRSGQRRCAPLSNFAPGEIVRGSSAVSPF
jgi:hypothetical protein